MIQDLIYSVEEKTLLIEFEDGSVQSLSGRVAIDMFNFLMQQENDNDKSNRTGNNNMLTNNSNPIDNAKE